VTGDVKKYFSPTLIRVLYNKQHVITLLLKEGCRIMTKTTLKIQGMTCNHCVMRVAKALKAVPGVQDAQVDLQKAEAIVTYDEGKAGADKFSTAVVDAGYKVVSSGK
jgi:copper chaperone